MTTGQDGAVRMRSPVAPGNRDYQKEKAWTEAGSTSLSLFIVPLAPAWVPPENPPGTKEKGLHMVRKRNKRGVKQSVEFECGLSQGCDRTLVLSKRSKTLKPRDMIPGSVIMELDSCGRGQDHRVRCGPQRLK